VINPAADQANTLSWRRIASLAAANGYPENGPRLFAGNGADQTGQAIEVIAINHERFIWRIK